MHRGEQSPWVRTARKRRPARGRANGDGWHPGSQAVWPFAGSTHAGEPRPKARRVSCGSPSHDAGVSGDEGCSAVSRVGARSDVASDSSPRAVGPRSRAVAARRSPRNAARILGVRASRKRRPDRVGNHAAREPGVRQAPRHSAFRLTTDHGSVARPRGRGGRGSCFRWARAHDRSCGRSRTTTSQPERATPRETRALHRPDSRGGRNPRSEPTSGLGSRRQNRETEATHRVRSPARVNVPCHGAARRRTQEPDDPI